MPGRLLAFGDLGRGPDRSLAGVDGEGYVFAGLREFAPKFFAGRVCYTPSGAPETAESIAYFRGTVKSAIAAARRPVLSANPHVKQNVAWFFVEIAVKVATIP